MSDTQHDISNSKRTRLERLEVEDDEQRQQRMRASGLSFYVWNSADRQEYADDIFMQLDNKQQQSRQPQGFNRAFDFGDRTTFKMQPPTERTFMSALWC